MQIHRRRRLYFIILLLTAISLAVGLALFALRRNINLYLTPTQVLRQHMAAQREFRLGGMVVKGSVQRVPGTLKLHFTLTDFQNTVSVYYQGVLPSLFREGQGIVAQGALNAKGVFIADQVLAKHDSNYHPPGIYHAKK
ncbi:MAG: cytochrome c maturation protein CcmE [Gammaproteobacteria bacterium]|nr:cytochrome c maturation protein CcmE [Gammaproteobacteria bacterium]